MTQADRISQWAVPQQRSVARIQKIVAQAYGLEPAAMLRHDRRRNVAWPRQVAMYLARTETTKSLPHLGRLFGGHHHTTVLHAVKAVESRMDEIALYREEIRHLRRKVRANRPQVAALQRLGAQAR